MKYFERAFMMSRLEMPGVDKNHETWRFSARRQGLPGHRVKRRPRPFVDNARRSLAGEALVDLVGRSRGCVPEATKGARGFLPRVAQAFQRNIDIVSQRYYIFAVSIIVPF